MSERLRCAEQANGGEPCAALSGVVAVEADGVPRCLTHATDPVRVRRREDRNFKGGRGRRRILDPKSTPRPRFRSHGSVVRFFEWVAWTALTDPEADLRGLAEARAAATASLQARGVQAQEQMVEALLRLEHGGAAVLMLSTLREGLAAGRRRPLPGRPALSLSPQGEGA